MSELEKYEVKVFGISTDSVEANKEFCAANKYQFTVLSDPDKSYARELGVLSPQNGFARRWTYVIDKDGVIREIDVMVKPGTHGKDLAARLEALKVPRK